MLITESKQERALTFHLTGRLDSLCSSDLQERLISAFDRYEQVILDFEQVQYISSTGLRVLLMAQKTAAGTHKKFMLINVPEMVGEVLRQTGFSEIIEMR